MKVTDWFDGRVFPLHDGGYERKYNGGTRMDYFRSRIWWESDTMFGHTCINQYLPWRGLTEEAK